MLQFLKQRWVYHLLIWLLIIVVLLYLDWMESKGGNVINLLSDQLKVIPVAGIVYANFALKMFVFDKRQYGLYLVLLVALIIAGTSLLYYVDFLNGGYLNSVQQTMINVVAIIPASLGLQYFKRGIVNQYQLQELKAKTYETELNVLKAQINPHFLFNTLNNIYGLNQIDSEKGSEMIMELSDVMRYHLLYSKKEKISLKNEVQLLKAYIRLEQMRLNNNCDLQVDLESINEHLLIAPLLFLPFVENAFKHGTHSTSFCFISLQLKTEGNTVLFNLVNSIIPNKRIVTTNIGLENTIRRLELVYGDHQSLAIDKNKLEYRVSLKIEI